MGRHGGATRVKVKKRRVRRALTGVRNWFVTWDEPVEDVDQVRPFRPFMVPDETPVVAATPRPAPVVHEPVPSKVFIDYLHETCTYLPQGLAWETPPGEARLILGALDGTNDQLRHLVEQYSIALKAQPVERELPGGATHFAIAATFDVVDVRVLIEVTLAADAPVRLRCEREARGVTEDTAVFDLPDVTGPHQAMPVALLDAEVAE